MGEGLFCVVVLRDAPEVFFPIGKSSVRRPAAGSIFPIGKKIGTELFPKDKLYGTGKWLNLLHLFRWPSWAS
jgi:hypothetical protein